ncbi:uncharacterized protein atf5b [Electrophorus electricus]|uniref:uncharacterized protein atf5b n=1 Tax=Electrophorus electricus TaxID=8005 RepID=UPI000F0A3166|nr:uncharacterized protein atf5b [Electrophorus electricus]
MTSLLKEELAQLEDYYLFESTPMKAEKWQKCDKGLQAMAAQSYYQLPCTSYGVNQSETNPRLVTLATGELDLRGFCGSSVGRTKMPRPSPYSYVRTHSSSQRIAPNGCKDVEVFEKETWTFKGTHSGYTEMAFDQCSVDKFFGKHHTSGKKVRECAILLKEEEKSCLTEDVFYRAEMMKSFDAGASLDTYHRRADQSLECLSGDSVGSSLEFPTQKPMPRPRESPCVFKPDVKVGSLERNHGERKQKKRDQNKTAAYRYRQRKRAEQDCLEEELHSLEGRNRELRDKAESVEREIQYVKDLLIEVYKARSQRLKEDSSA